MPTATYYLRWGVIQLSLANMLVIVSMIVIFVLALVLPFPHGRSEEKDAGESDVDE
jgi:hypothetical protein